MNIRNACLFSFKSMESCLAKKTEQADIVIPWPSENFVFVADDDLTGWVHHLNGAVKYVFD